MQQHQIKLQRLQQDVRESNPKLGLSETAGLAFQPKEGTQQRKQMKQQHLSV